MTATLLSTSTAAAASTRARSGHGDVIDERDRSIRALSAINRVFVRAYHQLEVVSPPRFAARGAAIICCNHTSGIDPLFIQSCCPRLIRWMMAQEYLDLPVLSRVFRAVGVIPVARSGRDTAATRAALRALHHGQVLGIFPEGRIEPGDELLEFQSGVALMAMKTGVPVYPVFLDGTQRRLPMKRAFAEAQRAVIAFGPEVQFDHTDSSREGQERATAAIQGAVEGLRRRVLPARGRRGG